MGIILIFVGERLVARRNRVSEIRDRYLVAGVEVTIIIIVPRMRAIIIIIIFNNIILYYAFYLYVWYIPNTGT